MTGTSIEHGRRRSAETLWSSFSVPAVVRFFIADLLRDLAERLDPLPKPKPKPTVYRGVYFCSACGETVAGSLHSCQPTT